MGAVVEFALLCATMFVTWLVVGLMMVAFARRFPNRGPEWFRRVYARAEAGAALASQRRKAECFELRLKQVRELEMAFKRRVAEDVKAGLLPADLSARFLDDNWSSFFTVEVDCPELREKETFAYGWDDAPVYAPVNVAGVRPTKRSVEIIERLYAIAEEVEGWDNWKPGDGRMRILVTTAERLPVSA